VAALGGSTQQPAAHADICHASAAAAADRCCLSDLATLPQLE